MKKLDKNIITTAVVFALILAGLFSKTFLANMAESGAELHRDSSAAGLFPAVSEFTQNVETRSARGLSYYERLMDINSAYSRAKNVRIIEKDDSTVVLTESGYLANVRTFVPDGELDSCAATLKDLNAEVEKHGARLLYVLPPVKGYGLSYPANAGDFTKTNFDRFADSLEAHGIPTLNLIKAKEAEAVSDEEMFFITDHHWKPREGGLWAARRICDFLGIDHGGLLLEDSFDIETYDDWFLGSQGKKVGSFYSPFGLDDIEILTPKADTALIEEIPSKNSRREGSFKDTVLHFENLEPRDLYNKNPYATYSGGDFREQIITNPNNPEGAEIVIIRDSFGCAVTPFLSLAASKLYVIDIRDGGYAGEKVDVYEYIAEKKPDYVIVLYSGVANTSGQFDFEN